MTDEPKRPERDLDFLRKRISFPGLDRSALPLAKLTERSVEALVEAEKALFEGFWNCGYDPDCLWAEPLATVGAVLDDLQLIAPHSQRGDQKHD